MNDRQRTIQSLTEYLRPRQNLTVEDHIKIKKEMELKARFLVDFYNMQEIDIAQIKEAYSETYTD